MQMLANLAYRRDAINAQAIFQTPLGAVHDLPDEVLVPRRVPDFTSQSARVPHHLRSSKGVGLDEGTTDMHLHRDSCANIREDWSDRSNLSPSNRNS
jgi:hypothetical protein